MAVGSYSGRKERTNVSGVVPSAGKHDAPGLPARGGRVIAVNRNQICPRPEAMGNLLDSIDRVVEEVAAKQLVPFSGWWPRVECFWITRDLRHPAGGIRSRIASGSRCVANVGELYGSDKALSTSERPRVLARLAH
jgi:hypothetical protein